MTGTEAEPEPGESGNDSVQGSAAPGELVSVSVPAANLIAELAEKVGAVPRNDEGQFGATRSVHAVMSAVGSEMPKLGITLSREVVEDGFVPDERNASKGTLRTKYRYTWQTPFGPLPCGESVMVQYGAIAATTCAAMESFAWKGAVCQSLGLPTNELVDPEFDKDLARPQPARPQPARPQPARPQRQQSRDQPREPNEQQREAPDPDPAPEPIPAEIEAQREKNKAMGTVLAAAHGIKAIARQCWTQHVGKVMPDNPEFAERVAAAVEQAEEMMARREAAEEAQMDTADGVNHDGEPVDHALDTPEELAAAEPGLCGHVSPSGRECIAPAGHVEAGITRHTYPKAGQ